MNQTDTMPDDVDERLAERVRQAIYVKCAEGEVPTVLDLLELLGLPVGVVGDTLRRLAAQRALVLQSNGEILMAEPFSAIPTPFLIRSGDRQWWGNCCQCCGTGLTIGVAQGERLTSGAGVAHFLVPARFWWEQIVFT